MANPEMANVVEVTREIPGSVEEIAALLEEPDSVSLWNPLLKGARLREGVLQGSDSVLEWDAEVFGVPLKGHSVVTTWEPGQRYVWRNKEERLGLSNEGGFALRQTGGNVSVTAHLTYELPREAATLLNIVGLRGFLERAISDALDEVGGTVAARREGKESK